MWVQRNESRSPGKVASGLNCLTPDTEDTYYFLCCGVCICVFVSLCVFAGAFLKICFYFELCVYMCLCICEYRHPESPEEVIRHSGAVVPGCCEPPDVVLEMELESSGRMPNILNHRALSPLPSRCILKREGTAFQ